MMIERPGEVVTREEMQKRLWPADTFVDFDHSVNTAIKKLRQALGADKNKPRFVETLPKRGYRFLAGVKRPASSAAIAETRVAAHDAARDAAACAWVGRVAQGGWEGLHSVALVAVDERTWAERY